MGVLGVGRNLKGLSADGKAQIAQLCADLAIDAHKAYSFSSDHFEVTEVDDAIRPYGSLLIGNE